ncbi:MAG: glutamate-cysteine ligase family protein [Marmoricola sp.]
MKELFLDEVSALFPRQSAARSVGVGIEHELLTRDLVDGSAVAIDRVRRAVRGSSYERWVGFEPGGQVELSLPCFPSVSALGRTWCRTVRWLREDCARSGVLLDAEPVDPRSPGTVPLQLTSPRYAGMQRHLDRIGPAGRRMMRQTASTQVCLDWWPGRAGGEQWRLLLLAGPFLAAAFARSSGPGSRLATWRAVDPSRTAYDNRLLRGHDPVAAYADFAAGAAVFAMPNTAETDEPTTFATWARTHDVDAAAVAHHLSTLFPPVRPRGRYLEVRFLDVQPDELVVPLSALLSRLLYDDDVRRQALRIVQYDDPRFVDHWETAAHAPERLADRGTALVRLAAGSRTTTTPDLVGVA